MLSNIPTDHTHQPQSEKDSPRITHSTDTEPEGEIFSNNHNNTNYHSNPNTEEKNKYEINEQVHTKWKAKNGFTRLIEKLPTYQYDIPKVSKNRKNYRDDSNLVPLNILETDNNRFVNYVDAFLHIAKHCQRYHYRFTRDNCRQYLKECYMIDFAHDEFIPILSHLSQKDFNKYFHLAQKELKYV